MRDEARSAVERIAESFGLLRRRDVSVLDLGGHAAGPIRKLFATAQWVTAADVEAWTPDRFHDVVVCVECLHTTPVWADVLKRAVEALRPGGVLIVTCASEGRQDPNPGGYYRQIKPAEMAGALSRTGVEMHGQEHTSPPGDLYAWAQRGR